MSERYSKLFALSENLYSVGAPVVIAAGALQKDNQTGKVFAQLKIRNIQNKSIKAATVKLTPFDTVGKPLGGTVDYQYLDLSAGRDTDFGQKTPVILKEAATRSFAVSVSEVAFSDNSVWTASNETWEPLSPSVVLETAFSDGELAKQYRIKYGADCKCIFKKEKDLWRCACGAINHDGEKNCHSCQKEATALAALNVDELKADRDRRLAAEQKKTAEEKAAAAEQAKKTKRIAMIAAPIVVVAIVAAVLISNLVKEEAARLDAYNAAVALAEAGQYDEAIAAFVGLGDYKDSTEQVKETTYNQAVALLQVRKYDEALSIFTELGSYKDSADITQQLPLEIEIYNNAMSAIEQGDFETAKAAIESNKYVTLNPSTISCIDFVTPYIGSWTFVSGDSQVIAMVEHLEGECHSIETTFSGENGIGGIEGTIVLSYICEVGDGWTVTDQMELDVDFWEKSIEQSIRTGNSNFNGRICIELTPQDTLLITVERNYGFTSTAFTSTAEYQRVS